MRPGSSITFLLVLLVFLRPHSQELGSVFAVYLADILTAGVFFVALSRRRASVSGLIFHAIVSTPVLIAALVLMNVDYLFVVFLYSYFYVASEWLWSELRRGNQIPEVYFFVVVLASFLISAIQLFEFPIVVEFVHAFWGNVKLRGVASESSIRLYGPFYNANWAGVCYAAMLHYFFVKIRQSLRVGRIIAILMLLTLIAFTGSRTAFSLVGISIFWFAINAAGARIKGQFFILFVLIFLLGVVTFSENKRLAQLKEVVMLQGDYSDNSSLSGRVSTWVKYWEGFKDDPLMGQPDLAGGIAHNSYLYFAGSMGLLGLFFAAMQWRLILRKQKLIHSPEHKHALAGAFMLFIASLTGEYLLATQVVLVYLFIYFALLGSHVRLNAED